MGRISVFFDKWVGRASGLATFWQFIPPGILAVLSAYLSTCVGWINELGSWGWLMSGIVTFAIVSTALYLIARARLWHIESRFRVKLATGSSPFDPMARVFENKRILLKDLVPLGSGQIKGRKFVGCEIVGPGDIAVAIRSEMSLPFPLFSNNTYHNVNFIQIAGGVNPFNTIAFYDCDFDGCDFFSLNLLFFERGPDNWHWITPVHQHPILENQSGPETT